MKEKQAESTVITFVLPPENIEQDATITVKQGELGHITAFQYSDFADLCRALNTALTSFVQVQDNPPQNIQSAKPVTNTYKKKAAGKAPYHLLDASGNRRKVTMIDSFELQEKYQRNNKNLKFDSLDEAVSVAEQLVEAGDKQITVVFSNGKPAKVIPDDESSSET